MELPYLSNKTIKTISTIESSGSIDEVRITHSDGAVLIITGEYIKIRFEPAAAQVQPVVTAQTRWPGE